MDALMRNRPGGRFGGIDDLSLLGSRHGWDCPSSLLSGVTSSGRRGSWLAAPSLASCPQYRRGMRACQVNRQRSLERVTRPRSSAPIPVTDRRRRRSCEASALRLVLPGSRCRAPHAQEPPCGRPLQPSFRRPSPDSLQTLGERGAEKLRNLRPPERSVLAKREGTLHVGGGELCGEVTHILLKRGSHNGLLSVGDVVDVHVHNIDDPSHVVKYLDVTRKGDL